MVLDQAVHQIVKDLIYNLLNAVFDSKIFLWRIYSVHIWNCDDKKHSCEVNCISKDTSARVSPTDKKKNILLKNKMHFCLKASRRPALAQSLNSSGKPGGNSKAANALVRHVCQGIRRCCCRNIFWSLASGPSNLDPKRSIEFSEQNHVKSGECSEPFVLPITPVLFELWKCGGGMLWN